MPIYEYQCPACGEHFSHFWRSIRAAETQQPPPCPACQHPQSQRILSQVAVLDGLGGLTPAEQSQKRAREARLAAITPKEQIDRLRSGRNNQGGAA